MAETEAQRKKRIAAKVAARAKERAAYHRAVEAGERPSKSALTTKPKKVSATTAAYLEQEGVSSIKELSRTKEAPKPVEKKVTTLPAIALKQDKPKKTGIAALAEEKTLAGRATKFITSPKTTLLLGTILAGLLTAGGVGVSAGTRVGAGVITRTGTRGAVKGFVSRSLTTQRAFVGKPVATGVQKLFSIGGNAAKRAPVVGRFASNVKSASLTKKLLIGAGISLAGASIAKDIIGTYPFAAFIGKEEAAQTLSLPMWQAIEAGDLEGAETLLNASQELVNAEPTLRDKIPYANVWKSVQDNIDAVRIANVEWARIIDILKKESAAEETEFQAERRESDELARQRQLEERERDAEYFRLIREGKFEEAEELLQSELKGGEQDGRE